jgi:hypothetical protein
MKWDEDGIAVCEFGIGLDNIQWLIHRTLRELLS